MTITAEEKPKQKDIYPFNTVQGICSLIGISTATYYKWRALGRAPKETRLPGAVIRISREDFLAWKAQYENPTGEIATEINGQKAKFKDRSVYATSGGAR